jgi:hypothetical protein
VRYPPELYARERECSHRRSGMVGEALLGTKSRRKAPAWYPAAAPGGSVCEASRQTYVVRPTANAPVGVGRVVSRLWSSSSNPSKTVIPMTHNMTTVTTALIGHRTALKRESLHDRRPASGVTIVMRTNDPRGTTRNGRASFEPGGAEIIFP